MMSFMRTTFNISDAVLEELRERARRTNRPLNKVAEETLQRGLAATTQPKASIKIPTFSVGVKPAYRGMSMNQLYDQLEAENQAKVAES